MILHILHLNASSPNSNYANTLCILRLLIEKSQLLRLAQIIRETLQLDVSYHTYKHTNKKLFFNIILSGEPRTIMR
jgi:hypothetical protein